VLSTILGDGSSSRLTRSLVDSGLALRASAGTAGNRGPGLFTVKLVPNRGVDLAQLERLYDEELDRIRRDGVAPDELTKVANKVRADHVTSLQTTRGIARTMLFSNFYFGDPRAAFEEVARYEAVTASDVQRVAARYLTPEARHVIQVVPADGGAQ